MIRERRNRCLLAKTSSMRIYRALLGRATCDYPGRFLHVSPANKIIPLSFFFAPRPFLSSFLRRTNSTRSTNYGDRNSCSFAYVIAIKTRLVKTFRCHECCNLAVEISRCNHCDKNTSITYSPFAPSLLFNKDLINRFCYPGNIFRDVDCLE